MVSNLFRNKRVSNQTNSWLSKNTIPGNDFFFYVFGFWTVRFEVNELWLQHVLWLCRVSVQHHTGADWISNVQTVVLLITINTVNIFLQLSAVCVKDRVAEKRRDRGGWVETVKFCSVSNWTWLLEVFSNKHVSISRPGQQLCAFEQLMQVLIFVLAATLEPRDGS